MSRADGASYEINGRVVPSRLAMKMANRWCVRMCMPQRYDIPAYYDAELTGGGESLDVVFAPREAKREDDFDVPPY